MKVAIYTRVSTGKQETENQAELLREFDLVLFWALDRLSGEGVLPTLHHLQRLDG